MNKQMAKQTGIFMQQNIANKLKKKKKATYSISIKAPYKPGISI